MRKKLIVICLMVSIFLVNNSFIVAEEIGINDEYEYESLLPPRNENGLYTDGLSVIHTSDMWQPFSINVFENAATLKKASGLASGYSYCIASVSITKSVVTSNLCEAYYTSNGQFWSPVKTWNYTANESGGYAKLDKYTLTKSGTYIYEVIVKLYKGSTLTETYVKYSNKAFK